MHGAEGSSVCPCFLSGSCTIKGKHQFHDSDSRLPVQCVCLSTQDHSQQNGSFKALRLTFSYVVSLCAVSFSFEERDGELTYSMSYPEFNIIRF